MIRRIFVPLSLALALLLPSPSMSANKPIVAVFGVENRGADLSEEVLDRLSEYLGSLITSKGYLIVPPERLKEKLSAVKTESYKSCYDQACQVEIGRELAAQKTMATKIFKLGGKCKVTLTLYDLKMATSERAATVSGPCSEEGVVESMEKAVDNLTKHGVSTATKPTQLPKPTKVASKKKMIPAAAASQPEVKTEYDKLADRMAAEERKRKTYKDRMNRAWTAVEKFVVSGNMPKKEKVTVLRKFLDDFKAENPHKKKALARLDHLLKENKEARQKNSKLLWLVCSTRQNWNGEECEGDKIEQAWDTAVSTCPEGYRLPTREEMMKLLGGCSSSTRKGKRGRCWKCSGSQACSSLFKADRSKYWTSSEKGEYAWFADFTDGDISYASKSREYGVRCVRTVK